MIVEKILEAKRKKIKNYPVHSNRASEAGHPCIRYLVLNRTRWQEKALPSVDLQLIFDEGNLHESIIIRDLEEAGIKVLEQQRPFNWPKFQLTGSIDAKISINGSKLIPLEIKSMSPFTFSSVSSEDDFLKSKYTYMRKYPAQLQLYMLMDNSEESLMILKNKVNGALKEIPFHLNYEYAEGILKRLEEVNAHVARGTEPEAVWLDDTCPDCPFLHICHPPREGKEIQMIDDPNLEIKLDRREELKPLADEYKNLDEEIKEIIKGREKIVIGNWLITGKWIENKGGIKEIKPYKYWLPSIKKIA